MKLYIQTLLIFIVTFNVNSSDSNIKLKDKIEYKEIFP